MQKNRRTSWRSHLGRVRTGRRVNFLLYPARFPGADLGSFPGAVRITNSVVVNDNGMETGDRGFDAAGKQLWGADEKPYRFRKIADTAAQK
ncbi:CpcT/CpeT family chromophore lyase [Oxynema aestuarii]|uniref:CpcT/CpeT family chromophore lyase n=1 Tax=Oxynema aestuarii TaxID=2874213 RepID=UPI0024840B97|nr:CpcT/CpeT family chromophore lyase [Oxynema aestuarii]